MRQTDLITIVHYFDLTDIFRTQRVLCDLKHSLNNINNAAMFVQKVRKSNQIIALNLKKKPKSNVYVSDNSLTFYNNWFYFKTEVMICLLVESIEKSVDPILGVLYTWKVWFCPTSTSVIRTWYTELDRGEFSCTVTGVDRGRLEITGAEFIPATSFNYIFLIRLLNTWKYKYLLMWLYVLGVPTLYKKCFWAQVPVIVTQDVLRFLCCDQHALDQAF